MARTDGSSDMVQTCDACAEAGTGRVNDPSGATICPVCVADYDARLRRAAAAVAHEFGFKLSDQEEVYDTDYWTGVARRVLNAYEGVEEDG